MRLTLGCCMRRRWLAAMIAFWFSLGACLASISVHAAEEAAKKSEPLGLLKFVDPERDAVAGHWRLNGAVLISSPGVSWSRLQLPVDVPEEYTLSMVVERPAEGDQSADSFELGLVGGESQFLLVIEAFRLGGLFRLDDKEWNANESSFTGGLLGSGTPTTIRCTVRKNAIYAQVAGHTVLNWRGDFSRLSMPAEWAVPDKKRLFLGAEREYRIRDLVLSAPHVEDDWDSLTVLPLPSSTDEQPNPTIVKEVQRMAAEAGPAPLPSRGTAPIGAQWRKKVFGEAPLLYTAAYRAANAEPHARDAKALDLLDQFGRSAQGSAEQQALDPAATALLAAGCDDPLVQYAAAKIKMARGDRAAAMSLAKLSEEGFRSGKYPAKFVFRTTLLIAELLQSDVAAVAEHDAQARRAVAQIVAAAGEPLSDVERRSLVSRIDWEHDRSLRGMRAFLGAEMVRSKRADRWVKDLIEGREQIRLGWHARGGGYANTVAEAGWQQFGARLNRARVVLLDAWEKYPEFPEAAVELIAITMALGGVAGEDTRFWFDRAVEAEFDYLPAYHSLRWALRPRWGGSHEAMLAFGHECLATERFDTEVPWQFYTAVSDIASEFKDRKDFYRRPGIYEGLKKMIGGYCLQDVSDDVKHRHRSRLACAAWMSGNDAEASRIMAELADRVVAESFTEFGTTLDEVRKSLAADKPRVPDEPDRNE